MFTLRVGIEAATLEARNRGACILEVLGTEFALSGIPMVVNCSGLNRGWLYSSVGLRSNGRVDVALDRLLGNPCSWEAFHLCRNSCVNPSCRVGCGIVISNSCSLSGSEGSLARSTALALWLMLRAAKATILENATSVSCWSCCVQR